MLICFPMTGVLVRGLRLHSYPDTACRLRVGGLSVCCCHHLVLQLPLPLGLRLQLPLPLVLHIQGVALDAHALTPMMMQQEQHGLSAPAVPWIIGSSSSSCGSSSNSNSSSSNSNSSSSSSSSSSLALQESHLKSSWKGNQKSTCSSVKCKVMQSSWPLTREGGGQKNRGRSSSRSTRACCSINGNSISCSRGRGWGLSPRGRGRGWGLSPRRRGRGWGLSPRGRGLLLLLLLLLPLPLGPLPLPEPQLPLPLGSGSCPGCGWHRISVPMFGFMEAPTPTAPSCLARPSELSPSSL